MHELIEATGMVIKAAPSGDYDRRLVILTKERGKITAFARGARRSGSSLRAISSPFAFGTFSLSETRDAYNLYNAEISNYFGDLALDVENACYASYFCEFADYYGREGIEASETLNLLYASFRALIRDKVPKELLQRIFELKLMVINGEYTPDPAIKCCDSAVYAWQYVSAAPIDKLYTFLLNEEALRDFAYAVEKNRKMYVDREFHSLEILKAMQL